MSPRARSNFAWATSEGSDTIGRMPIALWGSSAGGLGLALIFASNSAARSQKKNPSSASNGNGLVGGRRGRGLSLINISSRRFAEGETRYKEALRPFNADTGDRGRLPFWEHFAPREILIPTCSFRRQRGSPHTGKIIHGQRRDEPDATWRSTWPL